jgi:PPOX class probable F420-dependent enzyme
LPVGVVVFDPGAAVATPTLGGVGLFAHGQAFTPRPGTNTPEEQRSLHLGTPSSSATGRLADLEGRKCCVLVTYKKSGAPVPSPLGFGTGNGRLYFHTGASHAKVRRFERNPQVRVAAAATARGRPRSAPFVGAARVLPKDEEAEAERCLAANYGFRSPPLHAVGPAARGRLREITPTPFDDGSVDKPD